MIKGFVRERKILKIAANLEEKNNIEKTGPERTLAKRGTSETWDVENRGRAVSPP